LIAIEHWHLSASMIKTNLRFRPVVRRRPRRPMVPAPQAPPLLPLGAARRTGKSKPLKTHDLSGSFRNGAGRAAFFRAVTRPSEAEP
jgi:hypothetical protein